VEGGVGLLWCWWVLLGDSKWWERRQRPSRPPYPPPRFYTHTTRLDAPGPIQTNQRVPPPPTTTTKQNQQQTDPEGRPGHARGPVRGHLGAAHAVALQGRGPPPRRHQPRRLLPHLRHRVGPASVVFGWIWMDGDMWKVASFGWLGRETSALLMPRPTTDPSGSKADPTPFNPPNTHRNVTPHHTTSHNTP
jgi:hypothetical protein